MIIRLKVFEQTLSIVDTKSVPRKGSKDYLVLLFLFSSDWKDLDKLCYLQKGDVSQPIDVVDGIVEVPEWFTQQDSFDVTLFGTNSSQEVPTNVVALRLENSNTLWEQDAPEPQPSWLAKVIDLNNHPPIPGDNGYWMLWDTDSGAYVESELPLPDMSGIPEGGTSGQLLSKTESGTEWIDPPQSGAQSDWNQNDDTQPDYVKNRPFYTGNPVETALVEETTLSFADAGGIYMAELATAFVATVGETYKVYWDGTAYECTCVEDSYGGYVIGNLSIGGEGSDTGEPFVMGVSNGIKINIFTADTSDTHTFSISGKQTQIVKIPAKYIDKNASGYIVIHKNSTMTKQEAQNYSNAILKGEVVFIIWGNLCINGISSGSNSTTGDYISLQTQNDGTYSISSNDGDLYKYEDRVFSYMALPKHRTSDDNIIYTSNYANRIEISPTKINDDVGSTDALFSVQPNGTKSKAFSVLGNGEAVTPALILYSSTSDSTKKFRITVDDNGTLAATEVT